MALMQWDVPEHINKKLKIKKAEAGIKTTKEALLKFCEEMLDEWKPTTKSSN